MPKQKRVLVTGGAGFIGSHVVDEFIASNYDVLALDNFSTGKKDNLGDCSFVDMDIRSGKLTEFVKHGGFDVICHLAAQSEVRASVAAPGLDASTNILGTLNLLEAVRASGRKTRIIFSSTGGALYGSLATLPTAEKSPKDPDSPYGISKLAAEHYLSMYARIHKVDSIVLRFGNVYGPRQNPFAEAGVVAIFCERLLRGQPLTIFGDGRQTRDYVYVRDVAKAVFWASRVSLPPVRSVDSRAFNIATGIGTSVLAVAETLKRVSGIDVPLQFEAARDGEVRDSMLLPQKAFDSGLPPNTTQIEKGLVATFSWFSSPAATTSDQSRSGGNAQIRSP